MIRAVDNPDRSARLRGIIALAIGVLIGTFLVRSCDDDGGYGRRVYAQTHTRAAYRLNGTTALPDAQVTPGAVNPAVIADLSGTPHVVAGLEVNICAKDFRATAIRKTIKDFARLKRLACAEYGVAVCDGTVEGDHLISIEIGGCKDCLANLWPQPMGEARVKDHQVEDVLPKLICTGKIKLADAQQCIAKDWVACAERVKALQEKGSTQ